MKRRESRTRTKKVPLRQVIADKIQSTTVEVFNRFDQETIDLDTLVYFVLQHFTVGLENYPEYYRAVKDHIVENFAVAQGSMRRKEDNSLRHILITYIAPQPETPPPRVSIRPKGGSIRPIRPSIKPPKS